jgi:hypothetical protein
MITQAELHELLNYDPETGVFTWRNDVMAGPQGGAIRKRAGDVAGGIDGYGYRLICTKQRRFRAHRLAWLYMTGEWPANDVDHINGDRIDNRWCNLRAATRAENLRNTKPHKDGSTGFKGVYWDKRQRRYYSQIMVSGKVFWLGSFKCPTAAHFAYSRAAKKLHGEFARVA